MKLKQCLQDYHGILFYRGIIIAPKFVKEDLNLKSLPKEAYLRLDGRKTCPHFNDQANCAIQHYYWFKDTICGQFAQSLFGTK